MLTGTLVAKTKAKSADGKRGYCIAAVEQGSQKLVRLVSVHSAASPFWEGNSVASLSIGVLIEDEVCDVWTPPLLCGLYPHKSDDVPCSRVTLLSGSTGMNHLFEVIMPLAVSLSSVWPAEVKIARNQVRVGEQVPSLTIVTGNLMRFTSGDASGHAALQLSDGTTQLVKVMCANTLRDAMAITNSSSHVGLLSGCFIVGLARAKHGDGCEMLLVGYAQRWPSNDTDNDPSSFTGPPHIAPLPFSFAAGSLFEIVGSRGAVYVGIGGRKHPPSDLAYPQIEQAELESSGHASGAPNQTGQKRKRDEEDKAD